MYSIVMLTAMSAGADVTPAPVVVPAPAVGYAPGIGCSGWGGCYGAASCHGAGYGCVGSCHGRGGHFFGKHRGGGFLGHKRGCHGGGYSCSGYNCFGSCYGGGMGGCYGSSWGPAVGMAPYTLHGYNTPNDVWGAARSVVWTSGYSPNLPPVMTVPVAPAPAGSDAKPNSANIKFRVPAETKIFVDGKLTPGSGTERSFYTPPLAAGKYFYDVKAELTVDGKTVTEEKRVIVEAGANLTETFPKLTSAAGQTGAVAGK
jgi:uncharacterized protein (TIGR03000 family)